MYLVEPKKALQDKDLCVVASTFNSLSLCVIRCVFFEIPSVSVPFFLALKTVVDGLPKTQYVGD